MDRKAESRSTWLAAASAEAAAAEGHEFTPAVEDDDIEGGLTSAVAQGAGESPPPIEVAVNLPHPVKVERDSGGEREGRVMIRDAESSQTPNPGRGNSYQQFAAVAAAAGEAAALEGEVREWLRLQRKARDFSPANVLAMIEWRSKAFRAEVARQLGPAARAKTVQGIFAEHERGLVQKLKDAGVEFVAIPNKNEHMRAAIAELVRHSDDGRKPSAAAAARRPGLDQWEAGKLAQRTTVEREAVNAGICLTPESLFIGRLRQWDALFGMVVDRHKNLAALARALDVARRTMSQADRRAAPPGDWHDRAVELREAGHTVPEIARLTGQKPDTVKKFLKRRGWLGGPSGGEV